MLRCVVILTEVLSAAGLLFTLHFHVRASFVNKQVMYRSQHTYALYRKESRQGGWFGGRPRWGGMPLTPRSDPPVSAAHLSSQPCTIPHMHELPSAPYTTPWMLTTACSLLGFFFTVWPLPPSFPQSTQWAPEPRHQHVPTSLSFLPQP